MTRSERFLSGFASGYAHMAVATVIGLWLTPFFLRHLGADTYGLWLVGAQMVSYLLLLDLGIVALLPREAAYVTGATGRRDAPELRPLLEKALGLAVLQTPVVVAAAAFALSRLPEAWSGLSGPLMAVLGVFVITFPLRVFQAALTGMQDLAFVARAQFGAWAAGTVVSVALVLAGWQLGALAAGWCVTQVAVLASCAARLALVFPAAMPGRLSLGALASARSYVARSVWISVSQIAQVLLNGTDVLIVAAILGPAATVPYTCTGKLIAVLANQPQAILQGAAPALSELRTAGDPARLFAVSSALAQATLAASGFVAVLVLAVNGGFVSWWVGAEQFGGWTLTALLLAAMVLRHFNTTSVYTIFCFGGDRRIALTGLADGLVTLAAGTLFVGALGIAGAPLGAIAGVLLVSLPLNLATVSRDTGVPRARLIAALGPWFWRCLALAAAAGAAGAWLVPASFPLLALAGSVAGAAYAAVILPTLLASPAGVYLQPLVSRARAALSLLSPGRRSSPRLDPQL